LSRCICWSHATASAEYEIWRVRHTQHPYHLQAVVVIVFLRVRRMDTFCAACRTC
jgi:hypothetical protein